MSGITVLVGRVVAVGEGHAVGVLLKGEVIPCGPLMGSVLPSTAHLEESV